MEPNPIITEMQARHLADQLVAREHNPNPPNKYPTEPFTSKTAARLLGVSTRTLARMMVTGAVKYTKGTSHWSPVTFTYVDIGLKKSVAAQQEIAIRTPQSDEPKAVDPIAPVKAAPAVATSDEPQPADRTTFRDSLGFTVDDPNAVTLLGSRPFGHNDDTDPRTTASCNIRYYSGSGDGTRTGFKATTGYGTDIEDLQQESDYYKTHRREALRRYGPR